MPEHTTLVYPPFSHTLGIHRARPVHLELFLGGRTRFADPQGVAAVKFTSDDDPDAPGDDYKLTLFGVNSDRGEILYNSSMQTLAIYGAEGEGEDRFRRPHGIAATADGRIYVADSGNRRIARLRWDPVGRGLRWAGEWSAGEVFDVTTDARGHVFASDRSADAVLRFAETTAPSPVAGERWPLPPDVQDPLGLAVGDSLDPWYHPDTYRLYLIDLDGARLRGYEADGTILAETTPDPLSRPGEDPGRFDYVALDYYGNVYVTDRGAGLVYKFDPELLHLATFPGPGPAEAALEEPRGIAIWKRFGQVFVAEREGAQYFFLGTDFRVSEPVIVRASSDPPRWELDLFLTESAIVTVRFLGSARDPLAVAEAGVYGTGEQTVAWGPEAWAEPSLDGWEERAERVSIEARPTYSSRKRFSLVRTFPLVWNGP
ncbi:MAG TPA: NHL repeat-containing protein [Gemmatimonadota bacterium]|nr:NHL repeat-containing protein [Gemmatimonadota bacterium]